MSLPRHLPQELLLLVLENAAGADARDARSMSHVDRRWRRLALITPGLWTVLDSRMGADGAREYAARSGHLPLDVRVIHRGVGTDSILLLNRVVDRFLDVAFAHSARWARFTTDTLLTEALMHVTDICAQHFLLKLGHYPGSMRVLDSVALRVNANLAHEFRDSQPNYRQLRCAPFSTRSLSLDAVPAWEREYFTPALERLELHSLAPSQQCGQSEDACPMHWRDPDLTPGLFQLVDFLTLSPNLRELVLDCSGPRLSGPQPVPVELRHLRAVTLRKMTTEAARRVLGSLLMPSLRELDLHLNGEHDGLLLVLAALPQSTTITHLRLCLTKPPAAPYVVCAPKRRKRKSTSADPTPPLDWVAFPELETLSLEGTHMTDAQVLALSALPRLRRLDLRSEPRISSGGVEQMLRARLADVQVCALRALNLIWCEKLVPKHAAALRELVPELGWLPSEGDSDEDDGDFDPHAEEDDSSDGNSSDDCGDDVSELALSPLRPRHQLRLA